MAGMKGWFQDLDGLLRGTTTQPDKLKEGTDHLRAGPFIFLCVVLGMVYGLFMGLFAVVNHEPRLYWQLLSSALKVPALFMLTLFVTFPSLYVFSALLGARMGPLTTLRVVMAAVTINITILVSLSPITGFFTLTTESYPFIKLLNILFFAISGFIGVKFLASLLNKLEQATRPAPPPAALPHLSDAGASAPQTLPGAVPLARPVGEPLPGRRVDDHVYSHGVFRVWVILYVVVGAQMAWVLRPFIADPNRPFEIFRERQANFFIDVFRTLGALFH